jgi:hypothetical protein
MVDIPNDLQNIKCVPIDSRYGSFFKKYNLKTENSKIQNIIDKKIIDFNSMSKYDFLRNYLINPTYSIHDFLYIKDASLRGFIFETMWDICFKCNVVPEYDRSSINHLNGKIEDMRMEEHRILKSYKNKLKNLELEDDFESKKAVLDEKKKKDIDNIFTDQFSKLNTIKNLQSYLRSNKVRSGSNAGISDITMKSKNDKKFIFVSSKYYINEKSVTQYDISHIIHATKEMNIEYNIVLVVNDKASFQRKINRSHKDYVIKSIKTIFDKNDLELFINNIRKMFIRLKLNTTTKSDEYDELFNKYFVDLGDKWKPLLPTRFENHMFFVMTENLTKISKPIIWYSMKPNTMIISMVYFMFSKPNLKYSICVHKSHLTKINYVGHINSRMSAYFGLDKVNITFHSSVESISKDCDILFSIIDNTEEQYRAIEIKSNELIKTNSYFCSIILYNNYLYPDKKNLDQVIKWSIEDDLKMKYMTIDTFTKYLSDNFHNKEYIFENIMEDMYGIKEFGLISNETINHMIGLYDKQPIINLFTNKNYKYKGNTFSRYEFLFRNEISINKILKDPKKICLLIDVLFGTNDTIHENYIYRNRIAKDYHIRNTNSNSNSKPNKIMLLLPELADETKIKECFIDNEYISQRYSYNKKDTINKGKQLIISYSKVDISDIPNLVDTIIILDDNIKIDLIMKILSTLIPTATIDKINIIDFQEKRISQINELFNGNDINSVHIDPDIPTKFK